MGLGLHGGGLESALFMARRGARLTITDTRDAQILAPSLEKLYAGLRGLGMSGSACADVRLVLGKHETADFVHADIIIKNPGVKPDSPYLQAARAQNVPIESDISLFLAENPARLSAITGSKGKSSTASALYFALNAARQAGILPGSAYLGGNITVSPLSFLDKLGADDDVVLELSSWQLADLRGKKAASGGALLKPRAAILTAILPDHQNWYGSMDAYVADKRVIYQGQDALHHCSVDCTIADSDDWGQSFLRETKAVPLTYGDGVEASVRRIAAMLGSGGGISGGEFAVDGEVGSLLSAALRVPGAHQRKNLLAAALAALFYGLPPAFIKSALADFPGIEHRLECFLEKDGIRYYNDSAATIPEAAAAAVFALTEAEAPGSGSPRLILVCGGADKELDFSPLAAALPRVWEIVLLDGTAREKLTALFAAHGKPFHGPIGSITEAARLCQALAKKAADTTSGAPTAVRVLLSPGCASFGMFLNEFDRGRKWKAAAAAEAAAEAAQF